MSKPRAGALKILLFSVWMILIVVSGAALWAAGLPLNAYPALVHDWFTSHGMWGPVLYIMIYSLRPVILFPAAVLTVTSGVMFGPLLGSAYTMIGENISGIFGFYLGRYFGRELVSGSGTKFVRDLDRYAHENAFTTVVLTRLLFLPFDLTNIACGMTGMRLAPFAAGTFVGIVPGVIVFVYFGGGFLDPRNLIVAGVILVLSLALAHWIKGHTPAGKKLAEDLHLTR